MSHDAVNHPSHYAEGWSNGAEVIDITENLNFNRGNAVKYIARAGVKDPDKLVEDLLKARWYLNRELGRLGHVDEAEAMREANPALAYVDFDVAKKSLEALREAQWVNGYTYNGVSPQL